LIEEPAKGHAGERREPFSGARSPSCELSLTASTLFKLSPLAARGKYNAERKHEQDPAKYDEGCHLAPVPKLGRFIAWDLNAG
jgi:hypothetical protein